MNSLFFILNIILFGIIGLGTAYGDIYRKKIMHSWLLFGVRYAGTFYVIFLSIAVLEKLGFSPFPALVFQLNLFSEIAINTGIAFIVSMIFWYIGIWAAGDTKLFTLSSFLIPLTFYTNSHLNWFPAFALLVNVLVPVLCFVLFKFLLHLLSNFYQLLRKQPKGSGQLFKGLFKDLRKWLVQFISMQTVVVSLGQLQQALMRYLGKFIPFQGAFFLLFIFGQKYMSGFFSNIFVRTCCTLYFIGYLLIGGFFAPQEVGRMLLMSFKLTLLMSLVTYLTTVLLDDYIEKQEVVTLSVRQLEPYMLLALRSEVVLMRDKKYFQAKIRKLYPDGLLEDQVRAIKKWYKKEGIKKIEIYKTFPFAPFIFLGGLITLFFKGSPFIALAVQLFKLVNLGLGINVLGLFLGR